MEPEDDRPEAAGPEQPAAAKGRQTGAATIGIGDVGAETVWAWAGQDKRRRQHRCNRRALPRRNRGQADLADQRGGADVLVQVLVDVLRTSCSYDVCTCTLLQPSLDGWAREIVWLRSADVV